ncbi:MAG: (Fe-S)-binding protein [Ignavibacteria bacterium]|nr:(Fe-S)-binding protein [Ignavibacteria bacterium]
MLPANVSGEYSRVINIQSLQALSHPTNELEKLCIHCGLCLPTCPTYCLTKSERSSPRGRLKLIRNSREHGNSYTKEFVAEMYFCLECLACESACPAGVPFGSYMESARAAIAEKKVLPLVTRILRSAMLKWSFKTRPRLVFISRVLRFVATSSKIKVFEPFRRAASKLGLPIRLVGLIPDGRIESVSSMRQIQPATSTGSKKLRVGFVTGCVMDISYSEVNVDTVELLRRFGCEVITPENQWCCGSVHAHQGEMVYARDMAADLMEKFEVDKLDVLVANAAGCSGFLKKYAALFQQNDPSRDKAMAFAGKVLDVVELLDALTRERYDLSLTIEYQNKRVTFDDPCHLIHAQKVRHAPRNVLRSIQKLDFVELPESDWCCGSAGIYNITHHAESMQLLDRKIRHIQSIGADIVITSNPGCMIQLKHGLAEHGLRTDVLHIVTYLRRALAA